MREKLEAIRREALASLERCADETALEAARLRFLGKKGELTTVLRGMREVPESERRAVGELANAVKSDVEQKLEAVRVRLAAEETTRSLERDRLDVTVPGIRLPRGRVHPLTRVFDEAIEVFVRMGFAVEQGPEIEDDYHNFEALNIPAEHPARDMQATLFVEGDCLLRTHTSPVQIRVMERQRPPLRIVIPGTVYRRDEIDASHSPMFHQIEGLLVDEHVTFGDLKGVLAEFLRGMFGPQTRLRFRPSFFPFTEPSAEVDIACTLCGGSGTSDSAPCRVCKASGWLEILGAGLVDPNVFGFVGYDPEKYSGFAFGVGIERIAMLKFEIGDIRLFTENDLRFLRQF